MKKLSAALLLLATTAYAQAYDNSLTEDAIKKRLAPIGSVYLEGDKAAIAADECVPHLHSSILSGYTVTWWHDFAVFGLPLTV